MELFEVKLSAPDFRSEKQEEIVEFIEAWSSSSIEGVDAITTPRGLNIEHIKEFKESFLNDEAKGALFELQKLITRGNVAIPKYKKLFARFEDIDKTKISVTVKNPETRKTKRTQVPLKFLKKVERCEWTIQDVIDYELFKEFKSFGADNYYSRIKRAQTYSDNSFGKMFEGAYCVSSRKSNFVEFTDALMNKMEETDTNYVYLDFLAVNNPNIQSHRNHYDEDTSYQSRSNFINNVFPNLGSSFDKIFAFVDDWTNPDIFLYGWCFYELYWAVHFNVPTYLLFPDQLKIDFEKGSSFEVENDFHSLHDIGSSLFTFFQHFEYQQLKAANLDDNTLIVERLVQESKERSNEKYVIQALSKTMLLLYANTIVDMGNMYVKSDKTIRNKVQLIRRCGYYLKKAKHYKAAKEFFILSRRLARTIEFNDLEELCSRSTLLADSYYDFAKCCCELALEYCRKEVKANSKEESSKYTALIKNEISRSAGFCKAANGHANLKIAAIIIGKFYNSLENNTLKRQYRIELTRKEADIILAAKIRLVKGTLKHAKRPYKERAELPDFTLDLIPILLSRINDVTSDLTKKIQMFSKSLFLFNKRIVLTQTEMFYVNGLVHFAVASIDIKNKTVINNHRFEKVMKKENLDFDWALEVFKNYHQEKRRSAPLYQLVYFLLDYIEVLKLKNPDGVLTEQKYFKIVNYLRHVIEDMLEINKLKRSNVQLQYMKMAYARSLYYESEIEIANKSYRDADDLLKKAAIHIREFKDHRAKTFMKNIAYKREEIVKHIADLPNKPLFATADEIPTIRPVTERYSQNMAP